MTRRYNRRYPAGRRDDKSVWDTNWHRIVARTGTNSRGVRVSIAIAALAGVFFALAVVMAVLVGVWTPCRSGDLAPGASMTCTPRGDFVLVRTDSADCVSYSSRAGSSFPHIEHKGSCEIYLGFDEYVVTRNRGSTTVHVVQKNKITAIPVFPAFVVFTAACLGLTAGSFVTCCSLTADPDAAAPPSNNKAVYAMKDPQGVDPPYDPTAAGVQPAPAPAYPGYTPGAEPAPAYPVYTPDAQPAPTYTGYTPGIVSGTQAITTY